MTLANSKLQFQMEKQFQQNEQNTFL